MALEIIYNLVDTTPRRRVHFFPHPCQQCAHLHPHKANTDANICTLLSSRSSTFAFFQLLIHAHTETTESLQLCKEWCSFGDVSNCALNVPSDGSEQVLVVVLLRLYLNKPQKRSLSKCFTFPLGQKCQHPLVDMFQGVIQDHRFGLKTKSFTTFLSQLSAFVSDVQKSLCAKLSRHDRHKNCY